MSEKIKHDLSIWQRAGKIQGSKNLMRSHCTVRTVNIKIRMFWLNLIERRKQRWNKTEILTKVVKSKGYRKKMTKVVKSED